MSKDILSQKEIDALLEGLGQEEEEAQVPDRVIEVVASRAESEGFPAELDSWGTDTISAEEVLETSIELWGEIEITGGAEARAVYYVDSESHEVWDSVAGEEEDVNAQELIEYFADAFTSTVASMSAEENGQLVDIRPLSPGEGDPAEVIGRLDQWFRLSLKFAAVDDADCSINLLLPEDLLSLLPGDETESTAPAEDASIECGAPQQKQVDEVSQTEPTEPRQKKHVQKAELPQFRTQERATGGQRDRRIDMLLDVPLQVSVELGRTSAQVRDILALGTGSVLELDKQAGDPVDLLVNGKLMARGEVVVVDENFAVRITEVISLENRLKNLR